MSEKTPFKVGFVAAGLLGAVVVVALLSVSIAAKPDSGSFIRLARATFDPLVSQPDFPEDMSLQASPVGTGGLYLVQFDGPVQAAWKNDLSRLGIQLYDYIPNYAFLAWMDDGMAQRAAAHSHVRWVGFYQPAYRLSPSLDGATGDQTVVLVTLPTVDEGVFRRSLDALGAEVHDAVLNEFAGYFRLTVDGAQLPALVRLPAVTWMEPYVAPRLLNDVARGDNIMRAETLWQDLGLYGDGQIVGVCDTGLDVGANNPAMNDDFEGRIFSIHDLSSDGADDICSGHGTHVAGSVLGSGVNSGSDPANHDYAGGSAGLAPEAQLVFQAVERAVIPPDLCVLLGVPGDLNDLFQQAYNDGARIHTNSWGAEAEGAYTAQSQQTDQFAWSNKDFTILFAAGNSGVDADEDGVVDLDSLLAPGTAKNCITVGGSENRRLTPSPNASSLTYGVLWPDDFSTLPISGDLTADNSAGMAAFSSRGPTDDGRIKPDVVAPATWVLSVYSQANHPADGGNQYDGWGAPLNRWYKYMGGTSMATPLLAGAATLVRDYYNDIAGLVTPSSALIKATLINGAYDLTPGQYGSGAFQEVSARPDNVQGWGRVDLVKTLMPDAPRVWWYDDYKAGLSTDDTVTYTDSFTTPLNVIDSAEPLRVTLVWTDYPGAPAAYSALVNDLDLEVVAPGGVHYRGNGTAWDRTNNVEGVEISTPALGAYTVVVRAFNVAQTSQPYALVVSGGLGAGACVPPQNADFYWEPRPVYVEAVTTFTATIGSGTLPLTYTWHFSADGTPVTQWTGVVSHTFNVSGTFPVTLSVANSCGVAAPVDHRVIVIAPGDESKSFLPVVLIQP